MNQNAQFMTNWNKMNKTIEQNAEKKRKAMANQRKALLMTNWNKMNETTIIDRRKAIELIKRNEPSEINKARQAIQIMVNGGYISPVLRNKAAQAIGGQSLYNEVNINKRFITELKQVCKILTVLYFTQLNNQMLFDLLYYANGIVRSWNFPIITEFEQNRGKNMNNASRIFSKQLRVHINNLNQLDFKEAQKHPGMFAIFVEIKKILHFEMGLNFNKNSRQYKKNERLAAIFFYQIFSFTSIFKRPIFIRPKDHKTKDQFMNVRIWLWEPIRQAARLLNSISVPNGQALMMANAYENVLKMNDLTTALKALESTKFPTDPYWNTKWLESQRPRINNINRVNNIHRVTARNFRVRS
jgi:hypothetical protein